jgi:hypothetical protein
MKKNIIIDRNKMLSGLEDLAKKEPPEKKISERSKNSKLNIVREYYDQISKLLKKGFTIENILESMRPGGLELTSKTFKSYFNKVKNERDTDELDKYKDNIINQLNNNVNIKNIIFSLDLSNISERKIRNYISDIRKNLKNKSTETIVKSENKTVKTNKNKDSGNFVNMADEDDL